MNTDNVLQSQAILLLCSVFNKNESRTIKPLTPTQYSRLATWLHHNKYTPADFLERQEELLNKWQDPKPSAKSEITKEQLAQLLQRSASMGFALEKWQQQKVWVLSRASQEYPKALKTAMTDTRPPLLYGIGNKDLLNTAGIGIVGSRDTNTNDEIYTQTLAKQVIDQGFTVVSGGAKGVDQTSMIAALEAGGSAIGILADSLLKSATNPHYRKALQEGRLLLITPYYPEAGFSPGNAMGRNKYIYLLSTGVVVAKSAETGGTWSGAIENLKKQWVPLWVRDIEQAGNQKLIDLGGQAIAQDSDKNLNFKQLASDFTFENTGKVKPETKIKNEDKQPDIFSGDLFSNQSIDDEEISATSNLEIESKIEVDAKSQIEIENQQSTAQGLKHDLGQEQEQEPEPESIKQNQTESLGVFLDTFYQVLQQQATQTHTPKSLAEKFPELTETIIKQWLKTLDEHGLVKRQGKKLVYTLITK